MKTLLEELQQELYTVGASVYQQDGAQAGGQPLKVMPQEVPMVLLLVAMPLTT